MMIVTATVYQTHDSTSNRIGSHRQAMRAYIQYNLIKNIIGRVARGSPKPHSAGYRLQPQLVGLSMRYEDRVFDVPEAAKREEVNVCEVMRT